MSKLPSDRNRAGNKSQKVSALNELSDALGEELTPEERMYLEQLEKNVRADLNLENPEAVETEIRRREWERITRSFNPASPLYKERTGDLKALRNRQDRPEEPEIPRKSYQDDPRYKQFYENLKRTQPISSSPYEEQVRPMTLEELERSGWSGGALPQQPPQPSAQPQHSRPISPELLPGTIMRFDDGSVAIYKDAVSGKDYALFYFFEPEGKLVPRGIFQEQYEKQRIGALPGELFEMMKEQGRWDRDLIIYHLDHYRYIPYIRQVERATPITGAMAEPRRGSLSASAETKTPRLESQRGDEVRRASASVERPAPTPPAQPPPQRDLLERGRMIRINIGGKNWDSVFWTKDEIGPIVAHNTNREWALMHLDLNRFKESVEYGDLLPPEKLSEIEESLARQEH